MSCESLSCESLRQRFTRALDAFARPQLTLLRRRACSYQVCGVTGLVLCVALGMTLAVRLGLSPRVLGLLVLTSVATFVALALATKVVVGEERLIYYHHEIAILAVAALTLRLLDQPLLPYLDVTVLALGLFLACGRVGCLMVGCCHGRPHPWGVAYRPEHAAAGFSDQLVGVRLFPVQAVESLFVFAVVALGSVLLWNGRPPGEALAIYVFAYGAARFVFELGRGDDRPYLKGFSEAQWTSLVLMAGGAAAGLRGGLPLAALQVAGAAFVVLAMLGVALKRRRDPAARHELLHARHISEVARVLRSLEASAAEPSAAAAVNLVETSGGLRLSHGRLAGGERPLDHYCLSRAGRPMGAAAAEAVAGLIERLRPGEGALELLLGSAGVFHLLAHRRTENTAL